MTAPYRTISTHRVNPCNDRLTIEVLDAPGSGGACHAYAIHGYDPALSPSLFDYHKFLRERDDSLDGVVLLFQNGPIGEVGVNGLTHEVLLAVLIDRLEAFQAGPYACHENAQALDFLLAAQSALLDRTKRRVQSGVEGTSEREP